MIAAGTMAAATSASDTQYVFPNAVAIGSASRSRAAGGSVCAAASPPPAPDPAADGTASPICRCSTTARTAVPIEPPMRCRTFSIGVARGTWLVSSSAYAAAIAGIIVKPSPTPRTTSEHASSAYDVEPVTCVNGSVPTISVSRPATTTGPPPMRSVSRPDQRIATAAPMPCGASSRPAYERGEPAVDLVVERQQEHAAEQRRADEHHRRRRAR